MNAQEIRKTFLDFFTSKGHKIVPSAPIVNKNDPTLMFANAGMNQFKDYFLGNQTPESRRIADTQKCLRVSGKHNDLHEVGRDSYHHTMFEMLGNWSFGDYFKEEAIAWAWELLTDVYGLPKDRLYATVFEGDEKESLARDDEAVFFWKKWISEDRILYFDKKDNFWEMGDTGPCGPCSEIHIDLRSESERQLISGADLVNRDHPLVVEIWNLVFIQFNRKADGKLEELPEKHVDTGMGFERLTMALQAKKSNYETDIFTPFIEQIEKASGKTYTNRYDDDAKTDIAMRVVADHLRAVAFAVADGQLPGSNGAGYVIRRILRRAVRYYYSFLNVDEPFMYTLLPLLAERFGAIFPELSAQEKLVAKVIEGEERAFLHTLEKGLYRFEGLDVADGQVRGEDAFELYDTYGFPLDLTLLIAEEKGLSVDEEGFNQALEAQRERSRKDAQKQVGDWTELHPEAEVHFLGYDTLEVNNAQVIKYRTQKHKKGEQHQIVIDQTPFYGESGGQTGDTGELWFGQTKVRVINTLKENDLIIHVVERLPDNIDVPVKALVDARRRGAITKNHTATHLMHAALHRVLGKHALQKGQDVDDRRLRFDFSHFEKIGAEEIAQIENIVNRKIRENIPLEEKRAIPIEEAKEAGAMMLFGEKYGELVRMITFDPSFSRELCGGSHVEATGEIGLFKILSEGGIAAGIRRIEAVTAETAVAFVESELTELAEIRAMLKNPQNAAKNVAALQEENKNLKRKLEKLLSAQAGSIKDELKKQAVAVNGVNLLSARVDLSDSGALKNLIFELEREMDDAVVLLGAVIKDKPQLMMAINKKLAASKGLNAGTIIRELAREIRGGGGGQAFFASAGGSNPDGLDKAIAKVKDLVAG